MYQSISNRQSVRIMYNVLFLCIVSLVIPHIRGAGVAVGEYDPKYGTYVGRFKTLHHDVTGDVYAVDNITMYVRGFNYDGEAPDAFFFAGNRSPKPSHRGFIIPDERGRTDPLGPYRNRNLIVNFPVTKKGQRSFQDIKWISVWCRKFAIDFGYVQIPTGIKTPKPENGGSLTTEDSTVKSSDVILADSETLNIKDFSFDGSIPDAIFVMGTGDKNADGQQIPNERGSKEPLGRYSRKTVSLKIPKAMKANRIQYFGIWSPSQGIISSVTFPSEMRLPPSSKTLL